jgi:hypothetical protein
MDRHQADARVQEYACGALWCIAAQVQDFGALRNISANNAKTLLVLLHLIDIDITVGTIVIRRVGNVIWCGADLQAVAAEVDGDDDLGSAKE